MVFWFVFCAKLGSRFGAKHEPDFGAKHEPDFRAKHEPGFRPFFENLGIWKNHRLWEGVVHFCAKMQCATNY